MRIYLDMCCYSRQFDENFSKGNFIEFKSVIWLRKKIIQKNFELVTSFMLHYENYRKKNLKQREKIDIFIKTYRKIYVGVENVEDLKILSEKIISSGIKIKDAYHIASAIFAKCDYFITVDKKILKYLCNEVKIISPKDFVNILEVWNLENELIQKGIKCLIKNLGYSEANEFLYQVVKNQIEYFDYTEWRRDHLFEGMSDEEILQDAIDYANGHQS